MLIGRNLHKKSREVSIKTRSTPASLSFNGQATEPTNIKWSIVNVHFSCITLVQCLHSKSDVMQKQVFLLTVQGNRMPELQHNKLLIHPNVKKNQYLDIGDYVLISISLKSLLLLLFSLS